MKSENIKPKLSNRVIIDLIDGFFIVYTGNPEDIYKNVLHTTYADSTLEDLMYIEKEQIHKKGYNALELLKNKNFEEYNKQKKNLEDNEEWFWKIYIKKVNEFLINQKFTNPEANIVYEKGKLNLIEDPDPIHNFILFNYLNENPKRIEILKYIPPFLLTDTYIYKLLEKYR